MTNRNDILSFDASADGHRANYVQIFASLTGGVGLIAPIRRALPRLLTVRFLVLTTFDTAPRAFLAILLLRSLLGRRSALVSLRARALLTRRGWRGLAGRAAMRSLGRLQSILPMSVVPLDGGERRAGFVIIRDPECWDLGPDDRRAEATALSDRLQAFVRGRRVLLFIGHIDPSKGLPFLRDIFLGDSGLSETIVPALCGPLLAGGEPWAEELRSCGAFVELRLLDRAELMSLYRVADAAWCCYPPARDLSSGIFGRAVQFGIAPVLRSGSVLDTLARDVPNAIRLDYGDVLQARARLGGTIVKVRPPPDQRSQQREQLRVLLFSHFGIAATLPSAGIADCRSAP
jgi:hypothetical protein